MANPRTYKQKRQRELCSCVFIYFGAFFITIYNIMQLKIKVCNVDILLLKNMIIAHGCPSYFETRKLYCSSFFSFHFCFFSKMKLYTLLSVGNKKENERIKV